MSTTDGLQPPPADVATPASGQLVDAPDDGAGPKETTSRSEDTVPAARRFLEDPPDHSIDTGERELDDEEEGLERVVAHARYEWDCACGDINDEGDISPVGREVVCAGCGRVSYCAEER